LVEKYPVTAIDPRQMTRKMYLKTSKNAPYVLQEKIDRFFFLAANIEKMFWSFLTFWPKQATRLT